MTGAAPDVLTRLREIDAEQLWIVYHTWSGLPQAKAVPHERFESIEREGVSFALANWEFTVPDAQVPEPIWGADEGDFKVLPDAATVRSVPYRAGVATAFGWLERHGEAWEGCLRSRVAEVTREYERRGYRLNVAFESEFHLLELDDGAYVPLDDVRMFALEGLDVRAEFLDKAFRALRELGCPPHQLAKEFGPGLYECSLLPQAPLAACDAFASMKEALKAIARDHGVIASFMPKPFSDGPGAGVHVHLAVEGGEGPDQDGALSEPVAAIVAGALECARGLTAIGTPIPNSFKRLQPGSWAPAHAAWGQENRSALIRQPSAQDPTHIEIRGVDGAANVYLYLLAVLGLGLRSLDNGVSAPVPAEFDLGHASEDQLEALGIELLPRGLTEALDALEADPALSEVIGASILERYVAVKRAEVAAFDRVVHPWELESYAEPI